MSIRVEDRDAERITESLLSRGRAREVVSAVEAPARAAR